MNSNQPDCEASQINKNDLENLIAVYEKNRYII